MINGKASFGSLVLFAWGIFSAAQAEAMPIVYADGGSIIDEYFRYNDLTYLTLSVNVENASGVSRVQGILVHPYGEGEFEKQMAGSDVVLSASISTFSDQIHFDVQLSEKLTDESTLLFSLRPVAGTDSTYNNRLKRQGAFQDAYPYSLAWAGLQAAGRDGSAIEIQKYASPVVIWQDYGTLYTVNTALLTKPVASVAFIKVNEDDFYPPWDFVYSSTVTDTHRYTYMDFYHVMDPGDTVVFVVQYMDGGEEYFTVSSMKDTVVLEPMSGIDFFGQLD